MVRGGVLVAALAMLVSVVAVEFWQFTLARLLLGLGSGAVGPSIRRIVVNRDREALGANLGALASFEVAGFVLGPLLAATTAELLGLRAPFAILAGLFLAVSVVVARLDLSAGAVTTERRVIRGLIAAPAMKAALAAGIAFYVTVGMFEAVWAVLLRDRGAETWVIGLTLSLFTIPMIFLAPIGGRQAQRRGPLRVVVGELDDCGGVHLLVWAPAKSLAPLPCLLHPCLGRLVHDAGQPGGGRAGEPARAAVIGTGDAGRGWAGGRRAHGSGCRLRVRARGTIRRERGHRRCDDAVPRHRHCVRQTIRESNSHAYT